MYAFFYFVALAADHAIDWCSSFSQLKDVEDDLSNFAHMVNTQATAEVTYFQGLRDWCQVR